MEQKGSREGGSEEEGEEGEERRGRGEKEGVRLRSRL